jgi:hypothetical protein
LPFLNGWYLREAAGWNRREADIADRGRGRRSWAESVPRRVDLGRTGMRAKQAFHFQREICSTTRSGNSNRPTKTGKAVICRERSFKGKEDRRDRSDRGYVLFLRAKRSTICGAASRRTPTSGLLPQSENCQYPLAHPEARTRRRVRTSASPARPRSIMAHVAGSGVGALPTPTISSVKVSAVAPLPQLHA